MSRHAWGPREDRSVPWSVLPVGQNRCTRPGCGVIQTSQPAPAEVLARYSGARITVYLTSEGAEIYGRAPACQGGNDGKDEKEQSAS